MRWRNEKVEGKKMKQKNGTPKCGVFILTTTKRNKY